MSYLSIPENQGGYFPVLKAFRVEVPLATKKDYPNVAAFVEGVLPEEVKDNLPIFGTGEKSEIYALNSGGRGVLLSDGQTNLRLKGNDIDGSITKIVAESPKNHIADIRSVAENMHDFRFDTNLLREGRIYELPTYQDKPFSMFTRETIGNERFASAVINYEFSRKGFFKPYEWQAAITYPKIQWRGRQCSTIVFKIPTLESDLRFAEIYRLAYLHLKHATPEELQELREDYGKFQLKLTTWQGFVSAIMLENKLVPTDASHQHQNYVLCHVSRSEIGASRVDHTSTAVNPEGAKRYAEMMKSDMSFFANMQIWLLHALELVKSCYKYDENRYTGYFDRAYKWHEGFDINEFPSIAAYCSQISDAFERGFKCKDPDPIPQQELVEIVGRINAVKIDMEKQIRVTNYQRRVLENGGFGKQIIKMTIPGRRR